MCAVYKYLIVSISLNISYECNGWNQHNWSLHILMKFSDPVCAVEVSKMPHFVYVLLGVFFSGIPNSESFIMTWL
jgi:hypothetical protein